jgi:dTDP-4-dehydrorhamnose 3,5-epimerase
MEVMPAPLSGVLMLKPRVFGDERGLFFESWNQRTFDEALGRPVCFVQDNRLRSARGVLRGLHYQVEPAAQGKLVSVLSGSIFDVVVDLRRDSSSFGQSFGLELRAEDHIMIWIPEGFAHGFLATSNAAEVAYKATNFYSPEHERCIRWDDPDLAIRWPLGDLEPTVSLKDAQGQRFAQIAAKSA